MGETEGRGEEKRLILPNLASMVIPIDWTASLDTIICPVRECSLVLSGICSAGGAEIDLASSRRHTQGGKAGKTWSPPMAGSR